MAISRLNFQGVRNIEQVESRPVDGFNFIVGANGAGKSSVLEAIYLLGAGRSFRASQYHHVIRHGAEQLTVYAELTEQGRPSHRVGIQRSRSGELKVRLDGENVSRLVDLVGLFPLQLLTPESSVLLTSGGRLRRQFLDWGLFHVERGFYSVWRQSERLLRQRNALLRSGAHYRLIAPWDEQLAPLALQIAQQREQYLQALIPFAEQACRRFLPELTVSFTYQYGWDAAQDYRQLLASYYDKDRRQGYSLVGPQRGGFKVKVDGAPAESVCSRGQLKLLVSALKLAQGRLMSEQVGKPCIFLVDDFAAELDATKRPLLIDTLVAIKSQVFVTATDQAFVDQILPILDAVGEPVVPRRVFLIEQGRLTTTTE